MNGTHVISEIYSCLVNNERNGMVMHQILSSLLDVRSLEHSATILTLLIDCITDYSFFDGQNICLIRESVKKYQPQ